jgi:hypothetical protein
MSKGKNTNSKKFEVLQGTLDLVVLKTLHALDRSTDAESPAASNS